MGRIHGTATCPFGITYLCNGAQPWHCDLPSRGGVRGGYLSSRGAELRHRDLPFRFHVEGICFYWGAAMALVRSSGLGVRGPEFGVQEFSTLHPKPSTLNHSTDTSKGREECLGSRGAEPRHGDLPFRDHVERHVDSWWAW